MKPFPFPEPRNHPRSPARPLKETVSEEVLEQARAAAREFYTSCFWFWHPDFQIKTAMDVRSVVENLREYGGHKAWRVAQQLQKCL